jgi:hypothetical protein
MVQQALEVTYLLLGVRILRANQAVNTLGLVCVNAIEVDKSAPLTLG